VTREDIAVGLDIGTTKVCTVVGHGDAQGKITIAGVGVVPSRGLRKGVVIDVEDTVTAIRDSVERARHMAGIDFDSVIAGVTGDHIQSSNLKGTVTAAAPDQVISQDDVERVLQAANLDVPRDREIIHSLPRYFAVDGQRGVRRPVGMCGQRLEVETHVVTGTASFLNNVKQCVERAGLDVDALVLEPIATSEAVATQDERELGVALIDIGGGTSDIAVFQEGSIIFSGVLPVGGNHVTRDISIGLRTPFDIAERLKIERGVASASLIAHGEALEVMTAGSGERLRLPRAVLGEIIEARMSELFEMARNSIVAAGVQNRLPAGVILSGGGAMLPGVVDLAQQIFESPVRLGKPIELLGWSDQVDTPQFSTGVGLLRYGLRQLSAANNATTIAVNAAQPATDYQRRIWGAPGVPPSPPLDAGGQGPSPATAPAPAVAPRAAAVSGYPPHVPEIAPDEDHAPEPVSGFGQATPFDRMSRKNERRAGDYADQPHPGLEPPPPQSLWQKFLTKLRQIIGFEMS